MTRPTVFVEFSPSGGLFQFGAQLGQALAADGRQVELWTGPDPELSFHTDGFSIRSVLPTWHPADQEVRSRAVRLIRRPLRAAQLVLAWIVLGALLIRSRPRAVVFSHWRFAFEPAFVAVYARLLPRTAFALIAHEPFPRSDAKDTSTVKSGRVLQACFAAAWQQLDVVFVLGSRTKELVQDHWRPHCPVLVIEHGDEGALDPEPDATTPVADTAPVALFFGTWTAYKGIDVLLDAFEHVRAERPDAELVMAGAVGADVDLPAVLARAESIGNVTTTTGYIPTDQVARIVGSARLLVTPYVRASQSGVVHLAYTFGRPVVATEVGDLAEAVHDGENGLL
nr:glycosyltransferase family 4 protein [Gordonia sp. (in: high G+C Gram-positive bacteria)]